MPSPSGIFVGLSQAELDEYRVAARDAILNGQWSSITGGMKTGSLIYQMKPQDVLQEVKYAEQQSGARAARVSKTYTDFWQPPCPPNVPNEQV